MFSGKNDEIDEIDFCLTLPEKIQKKTSKKREKKKRKRKLCKNFINSF